MINYDNLRLAAKGMVTLWVPVAQALGIVSWDGVQTGLVMAACIGSLDLLFRVWTVAPRDQQTIAGK